MSGSAAEQHPPPGDETSDQQPAPDQERSAIERRARNMGWVPREQWTSAQQWVDAGEFVDRAERILPIQNERLRAQGDTIERLNAQIAEQGQTLATIVASSRRAEQVGYRRAMAELEAKRDAAVERADTAGVRAVDREIRDLGPPPEPPQAQAPPQQRPPPPMNPVVQAWTARNPWFFRDPIANAASVAALTQVEREMPGYRLEDHLQEVENRIRQRFPEHFQTARRGDGYDVNPPTHYQEPPQNTRREAPAQVSSSGNAQARRPNPRSFEAMPADVKQQFERQKKMLDGKGEPLTKDEFARYYYEQFEEGPPPWQEEPQQR